ncbi:MarR family winged helix-turn-helix transcriptional regulator [Kineosporia succinea]|uniref:DNA-binding MarR family transcriptional regulator n=1 Tax=Kineosporia succinea TaxID=84632 RepID=A0ABT9PA15_9ACTN|nr:MarR family transcriptional regulator [Kineosporia succinea]MDP9829518.1 DNA-binding MarR family transcriptional regulator [Kineosporia succinea]
MTDESPADRSPEHETGLDLMTVLPRLAQISGVLNRGRLIERAMAASGLSVDRPAMSVLITLHMAGTPLRVGEIATRMQVVGPHVTRQLHELERRDLARRVPDPHDQRARLIELTETGSTAVRRYMETVLGWLSGATDGWSAEDQRTFGTLLERFVDDFSARIDALDA